MNGEQILDHTTTKRSTAFTTVDLDKPGKQVGFVMIPHSTHDDAWGVTRLPIAVISNGKGPTVILEGGNHGDEYEGPITICELIRELDPGEMQGRLILMPANNVHAVIAGTADVTCRRAEFQPYFPRRSLTAPSPSRSADFVAHEIFPRGDAFLDLHSGGSSLDILPSTVLEPTDDPDLASPECCRGPGVRCAADRGGQQSSAIRAPRPRQPVAPGLTTIGTEMGGGGTVRPDALAICRRGVRNVLAHLGVLPAAQRQCAAPMRRCSSFREPAPSYTQRPTAYSNRTIPMARRCALAMPPAASIAPGIRRANRRFCTIKRTGFSTAGASRAACVREIAAWWWRRPTAAS